MSASAGSTQRKEAGSIGLKIGPADRDTYYIRSALLQYYGTHDFAYTTYCVSYIDMPSGMQCIHLLLYFRTAVAFFFSFFILTIRNKIINQSRLPKLSSQPQFE